MDPQVETQKCSEIQICWKYALIYQKVLIIKKKNHEIIFYWNV